MEFAFILVQKRINRRFFNLDGHKFNNPMPGSLLVHPVMKKHFDDFLLVSQHVTQGTVTSSHYVIIRNTTSFKWDILQKISYKLTHMYAASTNYGDSLLFQQNSISMVPIQPTSVNSKQ